jgi:hypothetical protein
VSKLRTTSYATPLNASSGTVSGGTETVSAIQQIRGVQLS